MPGPPPVAALRQDSTGAGARRRPLASACRPTAEGGQAGIGEGPSSGRDGQRAAGTSSRSAAEPAAAFSARAARARPTIEMTMATISRV